MWFCYELCVCLCEPKRRKRGPRGFRGHQGETGATGSTGGVGATGATGTSGAPATPTSFIFFSSSPEVVPATPFALQFPSQGNTQPFDSSTTNPFPRDNAETFTV